MVAGVAIGIVPAGLFVETSAARLEYVGPCTNRLQPSSWTPWLSSVSFVGVVNIWQFFLFSTCVG